MPRHSLKKKGCKNNMSKKILSLINTKIDLVQETLEKILNKGDMQSDDYSNTTVTTPITESVGSYQSDMNGDNGVDSLSSLSDNASYDNDDVSPAPTLEASGSEAPGSDATGTEAPGSEAPGSDVLGTEAPGSEAPGSEVPAGSEASTADNSSLPEGVGHGQYSQDSFFEGKYHDEKPQQTTGGKRRTNKRNKRRNMKSRRRS